MITVGILLCFTCYVAKAFPFQSRGIHTTTSIPTTVPPGCHYNNKFYPPDSVIEKGYDPNTNWCYETHCDSDGNLQNWDNFNCKTTSTTTAPPTTIPGCVYNGNFYPFGSLIDKGYDPSTNWCYSSHCDMRGTVQHWDNFHCMTTPTTIPPPTTVPGCVYNGKHYPLGSTIEKGYDQSSNWCYSTYCDRNGQILHGDNFNCVTTIPTTTGTPASSPAPAGSIVG